MVSHTGFWGKGLGVDFRGCGFGVWLVVSKHTYYARLSNNLVFIVHSLQIYTNH